jgi:DNA methylase
VADVSEYRPFLERKVCLAEQDGLLIDPSEINPILKPHQRDAVCWMVEGGRRACFAAFGLGKSIIQLEVLRIIIEKVGGRALIVAPLAVRLDFQRDAAMLGIDLRFIRSIDEASDTGIYITNYETVRDGKLDPRHFTASSLDEAAILRGFGGVKTFREFMALFAGDDRRDMLNSRVRSEPLRYRFVATATPSPNDYIELLAYAAFLGIMDVSAAKTRFFKRDSEKADQLTLHAHKEREFWLWMSSWALFVQKPSDMGYSDEGYELPELDVRWHELPSDTTVDERDKDGQVRMFSRSATDLSAAAREKRTSVPARVAKLLDLRAEDPAAHRILWHDLESERHAIERAIPDAAAVYGSQDLEEREELIAKFSDGAIAELAAKPVMLGSGCNLQRHCAWAIYLGIGFKFADFIQSIHRLHRFLQTKRVRIDLIYTRNEYDVRLALERKWEQHKELVATMAAIIREYGLGNAAKASAMSRALGCERVESHGRGFTAVRNDCVLETAGMLDDSIGLVLTSVPFSSQYEYSPNYADFGHSDTNEHFFEQMDFLTPNLFRVLQPGRICAVHVKDRIVPMGMTDYGCQTVYPFHADCIRHYIKHGFAYLGMKTIVTDVVRENNQTYRLGWTEQCKDGTKMGVGMPEYLLLFRKPATDQANAYADVPVVKDKEAYTRSRWQVDAHGFMRSSGNRFLAPEDLVGLESDVIFRLYKKHSLETVYDFEHHVACAEALERARQLPTTFMLLQPQSWSDEVWSDITRMRTMNTLQAQARQQQHLCPLPFDIVNRVIAQMSNPGDVVYDPFAGLMTVPYCALKLGRIGIGCELSADYFAAGVGYCQAAEREQSIPDLFELVEEDEPRRETA